MLATAGLDDMCFAVVVCGVRIGFEELYSYAECRELRNRRIIKNRAFHFPLPDLRNGASLPSPHVRNSGFRPFRMWASAGPNA